MNEILSTFSAQHNDKSKALFFKYYQDLLEGSIVEVGSKDSELEEYNNDGCYEFKVDCFGETKKLYLENKKPLGYSQEHDMNMYEFSLKGIEDLGSDE